MQDQRFDFDFEPEPEERAEPAPAVPEIDREPVVEPERDRLSGRQLMMVAGVMVTSGALMIAVLSARGEGGSTAGPAPSTSTATAAARERPMPPSPGWAENRATWAGTARRSAAFELPSRNETQVWMRTVRPLLVVRCVDGRIDTFVFTDSPAAMEPEDEDHTVRLALDGEDARTERWPDSSAHDALFAPNGTAFASRLMRARTLRFGYTPHNAAPVVANFDVTGLSDKLASSRACGRK